jgi:hypothetical protein
MRTIAIAMISIWISGAATATVAKHPRHPYRREYVKETFGKRALAGTGLDAGIQHARNSPHEWGRGPAELGKRVGSAFGTHVVKNSIQYGVAGMTGEDLHYHRSTKRGFGPRLRHALVSTVYTRKRNNGRHTVAAGRISGAMGSGLISRAWQPARLHTLSSGVATGGVMLGADAGANVAREFWPRKHHGRRQKIRG